MIESSRPNEFSVARRSIVHVAGWAFFGGTALFAAIQLPGVGTTIEFDGEPPWLTMRATLGALLASALLLLAIVARPVTRRTGIALVGFAIGGASIAIESAAASRAAPGAALLGTRVLFDLAFVAAAWTAFRCLREQSVEQGSGVPAAALERGVTVSIALLAGATIVRGAADVVLVFDMDVAPALRDAVGLAAMLVTVASSSVVAAGAFVSASRRWTVMPDVATPSEPSCERCGYRARGLAAGTSCPECGTPFACDAVASSPGTDLAWRRAIVVVATGVALGFGALLLATGASFVVFSLLPEAAPRLAAQPAIGWTVVTSGAAGRVVLAIATVVAVVRCGDPRLDGPPWCRVALLIAVALAIVDRLVDPIGLLWSAGFDGVGAAFVDRFVGATIQGVPSFFLLARLAWMAPAIGAFVARPLAVGAVALLLVATAAVSVAAAEMVRGWTGEPTALMATMTWVEGLAWPLAELLAIAAAWLVRRALADASAVDPR